MKDTAYLGLTSLAREKVNLSEIMTILVSGYAMVGRCSKFNFLYRSEDDITILYKHYCWLFRNIN